MSHANFAFVKFGKHLGDDEDELTDLKGFEFKGKSTDTVEFTITGEPEGDGYLLIQTYDVGVYSHEIVINDRPLPAHDIPPHPAANKWQTSMDYIPARRLRNGVNKIKIVRGDNESTTGKDKGDDNFYIQGVAIHWREKD